MKKIWTTFDKRQIEVKDLDDQHLANIYWFSLIFMDGPNPDILKEVMERFVSIPIPLWKPLPIPNEILDLRNLGLIQGESIVYKGNTIGSISHIKN